VAAPVVNAATGGRGPPRRRPLGWVEEEEREERCDAVGVEMREREEKPER
jgi:hypothetical protein